MDAIYLKKSTITPINSSNSGFLAPSFSHPRRFTKLSFPRNSQKVLIFASKDKAKVNQPEQLVLEEENPQLTLAKIIGRNSNSEVSNFEIEKLFYKKNGRSLSSDIEELPVDGIMERKLSNTLDGVDLVRQVAEEGVKYEVDDKSLLSSIKRPKLPVIKAVSSIRGSVPRVILRKPSAFTEDDDATGDLLKFKIQPNLSLVMGKEKGKERFSDITLVRKLEPSYDDKEHKCSITMNAKATSLVEKNNIESESVPAIKSKNLALPVKPELLNVDREQESGDDQDVSVVHGQQIDSVTGIQPLQRSGLRSSKITFSSTAEPEARLVNASGGESTLHKPTRVDQSVGGTSDVLGYETVVKNPIKNDCGVELEDLLTSTPINELEDRDWTIAEDLINTGGRDEVELISCSIRGFVVSFGSLIGFLPYRNLAPKYKYLAFETWLRLKGLDPSVYKQSLSIIGSCEDTSQAIALDSRAELRSDHKDYREVSSNMELDELLTIYDKDKLRFLTSFLGQKFKVNVILADRKSRRLIFSVKPKEKEEAVEKKRNLMAKLSIGEVVTCCIKKITYFGIFVEVEGVPALIHQTEVSWDVTLNPTSCFRIGQFVEAKVHQLDFSLERIFLSLKEVEPDPLIESLEAVIGDHVPLSRELTSAEADTEWTDMENLLKELNKFEGIHSVSRGRYFLSPGLAPTFQVYMASMFENQYKLLARAGNRVQEVIVETSLDKEDMKSAILTCTNIVE